MTALPADVARASSRTRAAHTSAAGKTRLRYASDSDPGYRRLGRGRRVRYVDDHGKRVSDAMELERIRALAVPPAWTDVWINPDPSGHLQAVGRDSRGRKQYRYHPEWRRLRDADKYRRMVRFARRLPRIRAAVERDLSRPGLPREKLLALVVRLLELTHLRVGGEAYLRLNRSYGLTTLRRRQARVEGAQVRFRFRGKGGKLHDVGIRDRRLARLIRKIQDLPGQRLFEYTDPEGARHAISSEDVNEYLGSISGTDVTAKDFRTWAGTVLAFRALRSQPPSERIHVERRQLKEAMAQVAERLGDTVTVTRTSYVDPALLAAWRGGGLHPAQARPSSDEDAGAPGPPTLAEEAALLRLLQRLGRAAATSAQRRAASWSPD